MRDKEVTINGKTLNLTGWAKELNISKQRISQLHAKGQLEQYVNGERAATGRPRIYDISPETIRDTMDMTAREVSKRFNLPMSSVYYYRHLYRKSTCGN